MNRCLLHLLCFGIFAILGLTPASGHAQVRHVQKKKAEKNHGSSHESNHCPNNLLSAYPWEYISDKNVKTWRFVVMNYFPEIFEQKKVESMGHAIEKFISKYFFPSWRVAVDIQFYVSPTEALIVSSGDGNLGAFNGPPAQVGTYIPIYLQDQFNPFTIGDNFGVAVHGTVSGSVINGPDAAYYLNESVYTYGGVPYGTPFIVIPAGGGTVTTGNGIAAQVAANKASHEGPTDFYQCLSYTICRQIIEVLVNPTGANYISTGNPLGLDSADEPRGNPNELLYIKEPVAPFSEGDCNTFTYKKWTMPNFAYPAYFFPYNNSGVYDFLGNTNAPFKPYKGTQFFMYQEQVYGEPSELQTGVIVSCPKAPCNNWFVVNGSIYDYANWGGLGGGELFSTRIQYNGAQFDAYFDKAIMTGDVTVYDMPSYEKKKFNKKEPQLFPFQYIDSCGDVVCRFRYINYIPDRLPPDQADEAIKLLETHMENSYLPYWGIKVDIKQDAIYSDKDLPEFDGTFIPFFYLRLSQFNLQKLGSGPIGGGAWNLCNVPNILTGPLLTEYMYDPPALPLGNPYLLVSESNFLSMMGLTSLLQPTTSAPGTFRVHFDNEKLPLDLRNNNINLRYISDLGVSAPDGVNNLDAPDGIAFLGGGVDNLGPYWDFAIEALVGSPQVGFDFLLEVAKKNDLSTVSDGIYLLTTQAAALRAQGAGDVLVSLSFNNMSYFSNVSAHEMEELCADPNYATFIATSNPPTDGAILFSQLEASDPVEGLATLQPGKKKALAMDAMPIPAYFSASLRTNNYDNTGYISRALVPYDRQQIIWQQQGDAIQVGATFGPQPNLALQTGGSIYDGGTFSYPIPQTTTPGFSGPVADSPLASIYESLLENKNL